MLKRIQAEHAEWLKREFPNQEPVFPAAGMVEEAGELMHALLKCQQKSVWGDEARYKAVDWNRKLRDAIGDCAIYACSLCNTNGWSFNKLHNDASKILVAEHPVFEQVATLVELGVACVLNPKGSQRAVNYLAVLLRICKQWNVDFVGIVCETWAKVKQRTRVRNGEYVV